MIIPGDIRREIKMRREKLRRCSTCKTGEYYGGEYKCREYMEIVFEFDDESRYVCDEWNGD